MTARTEVFRLRLHPQEAERLDRLAQERNLSKAALIRETLGLAKGVMPDEGTQLHHEAGAEQPVRAPHSIEGLAKQIYGSQGVPMSLARRLAAKRLNGR